MSHFHFKKFTINQSRTTLKVGTDAMLLGAFIKTNSPSFGLDVGAGTGVLSLMVAQNHSSINIDSVEIDSKSFEDLKQNITESVFNNQINFHNIDFFKFQPNKKYDLIFSNPPFYDDGLKLDSEINFHPKHNINFLKKDFFLKCIDLLFSSGELWIIVPFNKSEKWIKEALDLNLNLSKRIDLEAKPNNKVRTILVFSFILPVKVDESIFVIRDQDGLYTNEYHILTNDFHNKRPLK